MKRVLDITLVILLVSVGIGALLWSRAGVEEDEAIRATSAAVERLEREVRLRAGTGNAEVNPRGWPVRIEADWFLGEIPSNDLLGGGRPWVEIAPPADALLEHPRTRIAIDQSTASFWYNPANGVVRARIPAWVSDKRTTEVYNRVNSSSLGSIFSDLGIPGQPVLAWEQRENPGEQTALVDEFGEALFDDMDPTSSQN